MNKNETVVLKSFSRKTGSYDYLEFSMLDKEFVIGNSGSHEGHGNTLLRIEVKTKRELTEKAIMLNNQGYTEIKTFCPILREEDE